MVKKRLSRGRGPRIREDELERMIALYQEGKSFKAIGKEVKRHWQTVRKYTIRALEERPGRELRREALKEALVGHFRDLVEALGSLITLVQLPGEPNWTEQEWSPSVPNRRHRLLLEALRESHARESPLWALWENWNEYRKDYEETLATLRLKVEKKIMSLKKTSETGVTLTEYLAPMLFKRGVSIVRGSLIYDRSMLTIKSNVNQQEELWLAQSTHLATGNGMAGLQQHLSSIMKNMGEWAEVETLKMLFGKLAETKDKIEEEVEVLSLKRAFPQRCRLCPV